jgi:hypothetical protein
MDERAARAASAENDPTETVAAKFAVMHQAVRAVYALTATIPSISTEI